MRDPDAKVWGEPDPVPLHEFEAEHWWLVEVSDGGEWSTDDEFVDEVDAMAHAVHLAASEGHDATHVRLRHRYESVPVVELSCALLRGITRLFPVIR